MVKKTKTLGCFVIPHLMHMLRDAAQSDDFDLKKMIENGDLDKMLEEAKALAVVDKEKDDEQKEKEYEQKKLARQKQAAS